jgi:hypothetical protein
VKQEPWIESAVDTICNAFVNGADAARVYVPPDVDLEAFRSVIQEESGARTLVALLRATDDGTSAVARLADACGLLDHGVNAAREVASDKILHALIAFLEGLLSIDARCLVVVDGRLTADDEREFTELVTRAELRQLPLYVVHVSHVQAIPVEPVFESVLPIVTPDRRLRLVAAVAAVFVGVASTALYSWHRAAPQAPAMAARNGRDVPLAGSRLSLGTSAHDTESKAKPMTTIGVVQGSDDGILRQAERLARKPDVRALVELRTSIEESAQANGATPAPVLKKIDALLEDARRRQLELDHQRLTDIERARQR